MRVYIDCGAYNGDTLDCEKLFGFKADYKIAFEPNPNFFAILAQKEIDELHNAAVWIEETILPLAVDNTNSPQGSTIMPGKKEAWERFPKIDIHAIDFSDFLRTYKNDEVLIKMDIEGAEFSVLDKMIKDGTASIPSKMYVEFHPNKVNEYSTLHKDSLIEQLTKLTHIKEWH